MLSRSSRVVSVLSLASMSLFSISSFAVDPSTEFTPVAKAIPVDESAAGIAESYFVSKSETKATDLMEIPMSNAQVVVHLFQLGPKGESLFPYAKIRTGNNCESEEQMEFAVRWQRNQLGGLQIEDANLLVSPAYELKSRKTDSGNTIYNLPEPIIGSLTPYHLEIGKYSLTFTSPKYKERLRDDLIRVESVYVPTELANQQYVSFKISTRPTKDVPFTIKTVRINTETDANLRVKDPVTKEEYTATLMPYAVHFTKKSEPLLESRKWGLVAPTGTALHGADWEHIQPRGANNIGSAGCARLQSSFARGTFEAIRDLLVSQGATMDQSGQIEIKENEIHDPATGKIKQQVIAESPENAKNLQAMLETRKRVAIKGFMKATLDSLYWDAENKVTDGIQAMEQIFYAAARISEIDRSISAPAPQPKWGLIGRVFQSDRSNKKELQQERNRHVMTLRSHGLTYDQVLPQLSMLEYFVSYSRDRDTFLARIRDEVARSGQEKLPKSVQVIYIYDKRAEEVSNQVKALKNQADKDKALYSINQEEYAYYADPANSKRLQWFLARSLENYYRGKYNGNVPVACQQHAMSMYPR